MRNPITLVALALVLGIGGYLTAQSAGEKDKRISDAGIGLSKSSVFDVPTPPPVQFDTSDPGDEPLLPRINVESPPLVPHTVRDFLPITWEDNLCMECHFAVDGESDGTPIPDSHKTDLRNDPAKVGETVVGARFVCNTCHVAQTGASPLVGSSYRN